MIAIVNIVIVTDRYYTVVWGKLVVGNMHEKKFLGKKFSS